MSILNMRTVVYAIFTAVGPQHYFEDENSAWPTLRHFSEFHDALYYKLSVEDLNAGTSKYRNLSLSLIKWGNLQFPLFLYFFSRSTQIVGLENPETVISFLPSIMWR
jgi:hypothetical protein